MCTYRRLEIYVRAGVLCGPPRQVYNHAKALVSAGRKDWLGVQSSTLSKAPPPRARRRRCSFVCVVYSSIVVAVVVRR